MPEWKDPVRASSQDYVKITTKYKTLIENYLKSSWTEIL